MSWSRTQEVMKLDKDIFNKWADNYDKSVEGEETFPFAGYHKIQTMVKTMVLAGAGTKILDLGVGTGLGSVEFYKQGAEITGVDFSDNMLEKAREKMPEARLIKHDFSKSFPPPELREEKFDYIILSYALHHLPDWKKVEFLGELKEFLKPGGRIVVADVAFADRKTMQKARKKAGDRWDSSEHYPIIEDIAFSLEQKGFSLTFFQISFCAGILQLRQ